MTIDTPGNNDNRNYNYSDFPEGERAEYAIITELIPPHSSVVDLGCGNGELLLRLKKEKNVNGIGVELSESGVEICKKKGLHVQQGKIDETLPFSDNQFDYAVCNVTIQMVLYPEILFKEMKRIARFQIISFPNFAFWKNRMELLFAGRMPRKMLFGYSWYSTGHIHQLSLSDFYELLKAIGGMQVKQMRFHSPSNFIKNILLKLFPNLFQHIVIFYLEKK